MSSRRSGAARADLLLALAIVAIASAFRWIGLGETSLRADALEFWRICRQAITAGTVFGRWSELMGVSGQFPFPMALTKWFVDVMPGDFSLAKLRLPSAIWGVLAVVFAYRLGHVLRGRPGAILMATLTALHPFLLQMSREAYFYPPLVAGSYLLLQALLVAAGAWQDRTLPDAADRRWLVFGGAAGFFLMTWSQPTGWLPALAAAGLIVVLFIDLSRRKVVGSQGVLGGFAGACTLIGLPLLTLPWGLKQMIQISSGPVREVSQKALVTQSETVGSLLVKAMAVFGWGITPWRLVLTIAILLSGSWVIAMAWRKERRLLVLPILLVVGFVGFLLARERAGALFEIRYLISLFAAYQSVLVLGLVFVVARVTAKAPEVARTAAVVLVGALPLAGPAVLVLQLTGQPTPYTEIVRRVDAVLPKGTPVLVDRWFEPWNEFVPYPASNAVFTFTTPNEPLEAFLGGRWRDGAQMFFSRHPDAAYLEIAKTYWEVESVGPWEWPRRFFSRHERIANEAGVKLRELGLAARGDFYADNTNRLVVELFYNTRDDIAAKSAAAGVAVFPYYGDGWGFEKSGPMEFMRLKTQDFRDWRVLDGRAQLQVVNVTTSPVPVFITITAVAAGSAKTVEVSSDLRHTFTAGRLEPWRLGPIRAMPGVNLIDLVDPLWNRAQQPLFVDHVRVDPASGDEAAAAVSPVPAAAPGGTP